MIAILFILVEILSRLAPHLPNFTPVTAAAIFGGFYLNRKFAIIVPLIVLAISDYLLLYISPYNSPMINFSTIHPIADMFYSTTLFVWGSFMISGLIGLSLKKIGKRFYILGGTIIASLQFFLITNFGVWATTNFYPHNLNGLLQSYIMGLPFYRNTLLGDLFYVTLFFGVYELSLLIIKKLKFNFL